MYVECFCIRVCLRIFLMCITISEFKNNIFTNSTLTAKMKLNTEPINSRCIQEPNTFFKYAEKDVSIELVL